MKSKIIEIPFTRIFTTTQEITQALSKTSVETIKYEKHPFYDLILRSLNLNRRNTIENRALISESIGWKFSCDEN